VSDHPDQTHRLRYLRRRLLPGALIAAGLALVAGAGVGYMHATGSDDPAWPLWALTIGPAVAIVAAHAALVWRSGGAVYHIDGAAYVDHEGTMPHPELVREYHRIWAQGRKAVADRHGADALDAIDGATIHVGDTPPRIGGIRAALTYGPAQVIEMSDDRLLADAHGHELDHILSWQLFGDRDDWASRSHDERIALLEEM
jgi:hypothetical protein